jgi:peptidoglycan/xylan/chitin deacetylase (PgdA/CDA1 family)
VTELLPAYFSSLSAFRSIFEQGVPILTYHKLGPRPFRARLKGLYLGSMLFARQLRELNNAGFRTAPLERAILFPDNRRGWIGITFDDGFSSVHHHGLVPLAQNGFHAVQFLVAGLIGKTNEWDLAKGEVREPLMNESQIRDWLAAGHSIGSHTLTHPYLTRITSASAREQINSSKKRLEDQFGVPVFHFCYPFGDWNEPVRDYVREAGYYTACTTDIGVNTANNSPFALKRITARYPTRNFKCMVRCLAELLRRKTKSVSSL